MIKIYEDWYVTVESNPINYIVRRGAGTKVVGKDGKVRLADAPIAYCSDLYGAIKAIRDKVAAERFSEARLTLGEALRAQSEINAEFEEIIRREC